MKKHAVVIVGPEAEIKGFVAVGCVPMPATSSAEALEVLMGVKKNIDAEPVAVALVIDTLLADIAREDYEKLTKDPLPSIIPIPSAKGASGFGDTKMSRIVEQAIGSDIFDN